ncbi:MAG TPA: hypothetical protein VMQ65_00355 [Candidatus Limnocylindria bacterium]|nr:hypothetical protein [Candidatus Limnocylindria bacterium]
MTVLVRPIRRLLGRSEPDPYAVIGAPELLPAPVADQPGVAMDVQAVPGAPLRMSTGVMVIYADSESFTFMTPKGHGLSAWITFSAVRDGDSTVAQVQALERTADPFIELTYMLGANRMNDRFWERTLENLARSVGVVEPDVQTQKVCVDRRRQWRYVRNLRFSAAFLMPVGMITAPVRWLRHRSARPVGEKG